MSKLAWSANDVANTASHSYRIIEIGGSTSVVLRRKPNGQAMQYNDLESVEAAKQWAQNYHSKYGVSHE
jgi:hypothetical protein